MRFLKIGLGGVGVKVDIDGSKFSRNKYGRTAVDKPKKVPDVYLVVKKG
jgi:hypothetical protein